MIQVKFAVLQSQEVCINARQVLEQIKIAFPTETYRSIAKRAFVNPQSVQRWASVGRAKATAIRRLIASLESDVSIDDESIDSILLKDATPRQLKKQCQLTGWEQVINS